MVGGSEIGRKILTMTMKMCQKFLLVRRTGQLSSSTLLGYVVRMVRKRVNCPVYVIVSGVRPSIPSWDRRNEAGWSRPQKVSFGQ